MTRNTMTWLSALPIALAACAAGPQDESSGQQVIVVQAPTQAVIIQQQPCVVADTSLALGVGIAPPNQCVDGPSDADTTGGLDIVQLELAYNHSCALIIDGTVRCWGNNDYAQLGDGTTGSQKAPILVKGISDAQEICTGSLLSCARLRDGSVKCWGNNSANQSSGTPDRLSILREPTKVAGISGAVELSCGFQHVCARKNDGSISCWGKGMPGYGKTGRIRLPGKATLLQAGKGGACAVLAQGDVYCWSADEPPTPVKVEGFTGPVKQLALGERFGCALIEGGLVSCWGEGYNGQLGTGEPGESKIPMVVPQLYGVTLIEAEESYACARTQDGEMRCWGEVPGATKYEVETIKRMVPTPISPLAKVVSFGLGKNHYCAQPGARLVCCAGDNRSGQLGTNERQNEEFPALMAW